MAIFGKDKTKDKETDKKAVKTTVAKKSSMKDLYGDKKKTDTKKAETADIKKKKKTGNAYRILVKPLITEKASELGKENKYVFEVDVNSNKIVIAEAIEEVYGVKPVSVNTVNVLGKKVRSGKNMGKRKNRKKAVITLEKGQTINIYEGV